MSGQLKHLNSQSASLEASIAQKIASLKAGTLRLLEGHSVEMTTNRPTAAPTTRSAAAERMRRHRERRRDGLCCLTIELRETEIEVLVQKGLLNIDARNDARAVRKALYQFFDRTLIN